MLQYSNTFLGCKLYLLFEFCCNRNVNWHLIALYILKNVTIGAGDNYKWCYCGNACSFSLSSEKECI